MPSQGIDRVACQQGVDAEIPLRRRHAVAFADRLDEGRRQVGDRGDLELRAQAIEEREMDGLGDRPEPDDPDADALGPGRACVGGHRGEYIGRKPPT